LLAARGFDNPEVDDLRHRNAIVYGHKNVRGLDVAVDDTLLVRVLDGLANMMNRSSRREWRVSPRHNNR
jgi:hypothetical protein